MKASLLYVMVILASASSPMRGEQSLDSIQKMEASGDTMGARTALARAAHDYEPPDPNLKTRLANLKLPEKK